ncbi:MAG: hypothetical protein M0C28_11730 [Candidatus Moduliflexus flocculans]|nr:hypothetical protein [Candidatus Moduliflexus flocculans]
MTSLRRKLQITFVTGLLVIIPIAVPVWVFWELISFVDRLLDPFVGGTFPSTCPDWGCSSPSCSSSSWESSRPTWSDDGSWGGWTASCIASPSFAASTPR